MVEEPAKADKPAKTTEAPAEAVAPPAASSSPLFHRRKEAAPVIPIVRAPDDPGVDEDAAPEEFPERAPTTAGQSSGWRGYRPPR